MPESTATAALERRSPSDATSSNVGQALLFRFVIAAIGITAIGVAQIELERRRLLVERERVERSEATAEVRRKLGQLRIALAKQSAPAALLKRIDSPSKESVEQDAAASDDLNVPLRSAEVLRKASEGPQ